MEWQHPQWLYLILPLGVAWLALALGGRRRRRQAAEAFVASQMWARILPAESRVRFWVKSLLREVALIAGLVALAGPRFGTQYEDIVPRGSDLYVLIDVSRSMLATDVPSSRLARAKADVAALVKGLNGERVGLIAFAGQAVVKCPLTADYDAFRRSLDELDPASAPRGGTAIGDAIRKALEVFHAKAERDQAMLLITDGDDQQSYPLEAATVAAERHVTIFTVGLGDSDHGARVPQGADSASFVEYEGQQVWSKLDGSLLKEIALKTNGVYVPVGTRAYDLGELYVDHLQGRRGGDGAHQRRIRRSERFQPFLALALFALLADLCTPPYRTVPPSSQAGGPDASAKPASGSHGVASRTRLPVSVFVGLLLLCCLSATASADEPEAAFREGLLLYSQDEFVSARDKFAAAAEEFGKDEAADRAAVAAFNEACAAHRQGEVEQARTLYLEAGLTREKPLAAAAYFNLGTLEAEEARKLAGEHPENAPKESREKIVDQLKSAIVSFRRSLELRPDDARARRDIELVRMWIKYYSDQWSEHDRRQRRQESNLLEFLEFLIQGQTALRESAKTLPATAAADAFAELKQAQEELYDEIEPLKDKIESDLKPQQPAGAGTQPSNTKELEEATALLQQWADAAGEKMSSAADHLDTRQSAPATAEQQAAIDELGKIWDAVIPFRPLLARDLADQTLIAKTIEPDPSDSQAAADDTDPETDDLAVGTGHLTLDAAREDLARLVEIQTRTLRRTQLLKLKAEAELERLERSPQSGLPQSGSPQDDAQANDDDSDAEEAGDGEAEEDDSKKASDGRDDAAGDDSATSANPPPVDPEQLKAGYAKAVELAPKAVEYMQAALKSLTQDEREAAYSPAEEARKILEEIEKAQPREERPQDQDNKNQDQKDQEKEEQEKKDQEQENQDTNPQRKQGQDKKNDEKKDQEKKDQDKKDQEGEDQKRQDRKKPSPDGKEQPPLSRDRIEEALRKVRERQQEKRERDRKMKARVLGRVPVEKDW
ncbi:MAG TPA: VWA domain-containing protein [Pirellulales bacterium]|nr:VWA domain-containing protein [Pirellulales bacterium]HVC97338.1 VWA domain-containing protein [Pirellulales bacterium]